VYISVSLSGDLDVSRVVLCALRFVSLYGFFLTNDSLIKLLFLSIISGDPVDMTWSTWENKFFLRFVKLAFFISLFFHDVPTLSSMYIFFTF
jgi:hypothetical protein